MIKAQILSCYVTGKLLFTWTFAQNTKIGRNAGGLKGTRVLILLPHSFIWTANLDLAEAFFSATVSTEMAITTLETKQGTKTLMWEIYSSKITLRMYT